MSIVQPEPEQPEFFTDLLDSVHAYERQTSDFSQEIISTVIADYNFYGYAAAALGYSLLLILALLRSQKNPVNIFFVLAVSLSLAWSGYTAYALNTPAIFISEALPLETLCYGSWFLFLAILIIHQQFSENYALLIKTWYFHGLLLLVAALLLETATEFRYFVQYLLGLDPRFLFHLGFAIIGLVLIEQLYRNGSREQRWSVDDCQDSCPIFYATFSLTSCSSVSDFSGFNQTSLTGSQFRVSRLQRSGFRCFADS